MFKKQCLTFVMAFAVVLFMAGAALAEDIVVFNGTYFDIHAIALSDDQSDSWGDDLLGDEILHPGEGVTINLAGGTSGWDMAVVDDEGQQLEFRSLDFTGHSKITLYSDGTARFE